MLIFLTFAAFTVLGLIGCALQILAVRSSVSPLNSGEEGTLPRSFPSVSILKPLKGLDDNLFDNLESFCKQDYPEYEIIFSLQDHNDPAYKIARKIKDKYPQLDISLLVEPCDEGLNPKVNNLIPAYKIAKHQLILVSDSNVMVMRNYLREITIPMKEPGIGLVSNPIMGIGGRSLGAVLENLHMNSFVIGGVSFLDRYLKMPCVVGKSMLMRKEDLEAIGGFGAVKDVLAEDYLIGKMMHEQGKGVVLSRHIIENVNHYWGIGKFLNRHTRWGKLRWKIGGIRYVSELFGNPVFMSSLPIVLWQPSRLTVTFALITALLKILGDVSIGKRISSDMNPFLYCLSPMKDIIIGFIWFLPIMSNTVVWRGNRYLIGKDSLLSPCPHAASSSMTFRLINAVKERLA